MDKILILTDYRGAFYSTYETRSTTLTMDVAKVVRRLSSFGYMVEVKQYCNLDYQIKYNGEYVLYTSSEDAGLAYKSYIEDIILHIENMGARPLPRYKFLRAHHNKAMMELLRYELFPDSAIKLTTKVLGTLEDLHSRHTVGTGIWPKVIKSAYGAGAGLVGRAHDPVELQQLAREYSRSPGGWVAELKEIVKSKLRPGYQRWSTHRGKYVVQELIPGLKGDFKVLCMGQRYYCLYRKNRKNDFRASGSGLFTWDISHMVDESALLDYAEQTYKTLDTPLASLDVAFDGHSFHLIEFQILHFGTLTAERSSFYYAKKGGSWKKVEEECVIESVLADAVDMYIRHSNII